MVRRKVVGVVWLLRDRDMVRIVAGIACVSFRIMGRCETDQFEQSRYVVIVKEKPVNQLRQLIWVC